MRHVLLYGDSFFWGVNAATGGRHRHEDQIGVVCQRELGQGYNVVTEGLRGRTMFGENGWFPERNGLAQFGPIFASHLPLDIVVLMLGTNDLNTKTRHTPDQIAAAIDEYKQKMHFWCDFMKYDVPKLLIVSPPHLNEGELVVFREIFADSAGRIRELKNALSSYAKRHNDYFLNAAEIVHSYESDGVHLAAPENTTLATTIARSIQEIIQPQD